jgi:uncharacterized protein
MEMIHEFQVGADLDDTWAVLIDLDRLSRCLPGADMTEMDGDEYRGAFRIEVGPLSAVYRGGAKFSTLDAENRVAILTAGGRDRNGNGNVRAVITASLTPLDGGTAVRIATILTLTGKMFRLGPEMTTGAAADLFGRFVENVHTSLLPPRTAGEAQVEDTDFADEETAPVPAVAADAAAGTVSKAAMAEAVASVRAVLGSTGALDADGETAESDLSGDTVDGDGGIGRKLAVAAPLSLGLLVLVVVLRRLVARRTSAD